MDLEVAFEVIYLKLLIPQLAMHTRQSTYIQRINDALRYIDLHIDAELSLDVVAKVAFYSPFHFHRLFKAVTGEALLVYITRRRIEHSGLMLMHRPSMSVSEIAYAFGFSSVAVYSKTFKKVMGLSPTAFRDELNIKNSKIGQLDSKIGQDDLISEAYICNINNLKKWLMMQAKISIKDTHDLHFAYLTQIGVDGIESTFQQVLKWAGPKAILSKDETFISRVFHDSFKVTDESKVRMSIGIASRHELPDDQHMSSGVISGGKTFIGRFEITLEEFEPAWNSIFIEMHDRGYNKADGFPYELYHNNPANHPEKKYIVDLCIPIE
ncbi:MAG TPA: AraC family transcriptional regulator [Chitinophagales bacterium]|nr:AraC family transcriptional regulator [Chitinophagales bacterium]HNE45711.1 AraC family transcriptional regulator [Chitinophagales bacterium]HNF67776.1 AraC family transcriptional regulator [Chitinophagales bacterium]HNI54250.1 AraC family transcriptional regulator [Chitinophagales bacterium]HNJ90565.1 AraC family transcriptional regulator [Chitinophagales bacterium]